MVWCFSPYMAFYLFIYLEWMVASLFPHAKVSMYLSLTHQFSPTVCQKYKSLNMLILLGILSILYFFLRPLPYNSNLGTFLYDFLEGSFLCCILFCFVLFFYSMFPCFPSFMLVKHIQLWLPEELCMTAAAQSLAALYIWECLISTPRLLDSL